MSRLIIGDLDVTGILTGCYSDRKVDMKENKKSLVTVNGCACNKI